MTMKAIAQILYYLSCAPVVYYLYLIFVAYKKRTEKGEQSQAEVDRGKLIFKRFIISLIIAIILLVVYNLVPQPPTQGL